ncbi:hypothetical protein [Streptococcus sp. zg-JUN1979]|uniref:hypothetical protein n=1 Tax=Streptococcus sp. zg-JUN1979 TaxID=3391450 RepID=UPI0039A561CA
MLGDYSIMDLVTLGSIIAAIGTLLGAGVSIKNLISDNKALKENLDAIPQTISSGNASLSEKLVSEREVLSKESEVLYQKVIDERKILSRENRSIKDDTDYLVKQSLKEEMARENLYKNTERAKEILETMDMMKEVVLKNAFLNEEVSDLKTQLKQKDAEIEHNLLVLESENKALKKQNQELSEINGKNVIAAISSCERSLAELEAYGEAEEIKYILKRAKEKIVNALDNSMDK